METFESFYRHEIDYIRQRLKQAAQTHPELGAFSPEAGDPDIERLLESFAFLSAGLHGKIADDFPEITQNMLDKTWTFPLRPIPSTSVVQFFAAKSKFDRVLDLPARSRLFATHDGETIPFITTQSLHIEPVSLVKRSLSATNDQTTITLTCRYEGKEKKGFWQAGPVRLFLSRDSDVAALLMLWLDQHLSETAIALPQPQQTIQEKIETITVELPVETWTPCADNLTVPLRRDDFWPLQLLPEYFYLPHVNDFITLDVQQAMAQVPLSAQRQFEIILTFDGVMPLSEKEIASAFIPHCVPVINLGHGQHILNTRQNTSRYPILLENSLLFDVQRVHARKESDADNEGVTRVFREMNMKNLYGARFSGEETQQFYQLQHEYSPLDSVLSSLVLYDHMGQPVKHLPYETLTCNYLACYEKADAIRAGEIDTGGENVDSSLSISNLVAVSPCYPAKIKSQVHWSVISALSLSPFYFSDIEKVRHILSTFNFYPDENKPLSEKIVRHIDGLTSIEAVSIDRLEKGYPRRGMRLAVTLCEQHYVNQGEMYRFAIVLHHLFSVWQTENSFIEMDVINQQTQVRWHLGRVKGQRKLM